MFSQLTNRLMLLKSSIVISLSLSRLTDSRLQHPPRRPIRRSTPSIRKREPCVRGDLFHPASSRAAASWSSPCAKLPQALSCGHGKMQSLMCRGSVIHASDVTKESMPSLAYGVNNGRQLRQPGDFLVPHKVVPVNNRDVCDYSETNKSQAVLSEEMTGYLYLTMGQRQVSHRSGKMAQRIGINLKCEVTLSQNNAIMYRPIRCRQKNERTEQRTPDNSHYLLRWNGAVKLRHLRDGEFSSVCSADLLQLLLMGRSQRSNLQPQHHLTNHTNVTSTSLTNNKTEKIDQIWHIWIKKQRRTYLFTTPNQLSK